MAGVMRCVGAVVIQVLGGRAYVGKVVESGQGARLQRASNWRDLEIDAALSVHAQLGYLSFDGWYSCPHELAARARWVT